MPTGNAAWEEAQASAPPQVVVYHTLELQHPGFLDETGENQIPVRVVTLVSDDMDFGIEDGATFNAGEMAPFRAVMFEAGQPEFGEGKVPETTVTVDNVTRELMPHLRRAMTYRADLKVLYRQYRSDDLSEPCYGPTEFVMRNVVVKGTRMTGTARLDNLANRKFGLVYTIEEFPGLQP